MINEKELVNKIFKSISKIVFLDRKRIINYKDLKLFPSEIHLLLFVYHIQNTNITKIADHIGLTKGAISQTLSRLNRKGLIIKETDPYKKNQLHIQFTQKGEILMKHIIEVKKDMEDEYSKYLKTLSDKEKLVISNFLDKLVSILHKQRK